MATRAYDRAYRQIKCQTVLIDEPDIKSLASLVLLSKDYFQLDRGIYCTNRMQKIRDRWMRKMMKSPDSKGGLTCAICGRKGLQPFDSDKYKLATLDHLIDIQDGGQWNDESNFQVACKLCNHKKSETV